MDRNFYQQKLAEERQGEISKELATRHMLKEAGLNAPFMKRAVWIASRAAPAAIAIIILILLNFLR